MSEITVYFAFGFLANVSTELLDQFTDDLSPRRPRPPRESGKPNRFLLRQTSGLRPAGAAVAGCCVALVGVGGSNCVEL